MNLRDANIHTITAALSFITRGLADSAGVKASSRRKERLMIFPESPLFPNFEILLIPFLCLL
jgi:hypothetical protein